MAPPTESVESARGRAARFAGRLRRVAWLGALAWIGLCAFGAFVDRGPQLVALGAAVVVPLGLSLVAPPIAREGPRSAKAYAVAAGATVLAAPCALASLVTAPGPLGALLAAPWTLATFAIAAHGLARVARRGLSPLAELAIDVGQLYLPVGGVWLLASRAGVSLLGFREPIVTFTAAHFHFAGFAAPLVAGMLGRVLGVPSPRGAPGPRPSPIVTTVYRGSSATVLLGIPLVAAGITFGRALEAPAAIALSLGMLGMAALLVRAGVRARVRLAGATWIVAGVSLVFSMALVVIFTTTGSATRGAAVPLVPYATMADLHGVANAIGFAVCALVGFAIAKPAPSHGELSGTWPRLLGRGFVGPDFFDRAGAIDPRAVVHGQLDRLDDFAHEGFDPARVDPRVRAFYERTSSHVLIARPRWFLPFRPFARPWRWLARVALGNLELPVEPEVDADIEARLFALDEAVDGRPGARGYVRTHRARDGAPPRANFVAAYATHEGRGATYLSASFPLPSSALVAVLRFDDGPRPGSLVVTSAAPPGQGPGDEGMFLLTRLGPLRLPLDERIEVFVEGDALRARHETRVLGMRCFAIDYVLREAAE